MKRSTASNLLRMLNEGKMHIEDVMYGRSGRVDRDPYTMDDDEITVDQHLLAKAIHVVQLTLKEIEKCALR